jgi:hypothetical protein
MTEGWNPTSIRTAPVEVQRAYQESYLAGEIGAGIRMTLHDHFKGGIYLATQLATSTDTGEAMVVYCSVIYGTWHVRRSDEWNEVVWWPDGKMRSRFVARKRPEQPPAFKVPSPSGLAR